MPFERLAPQAVRHSDGYTVQIADRYHLEYLEGGRVARVEAEFGGPSVVVYSESLAWHRPDDQPMDDADRAEIIERLRRGVEAMGDVCEVVAD